MQPLDDQVCDVVDSPSISSALNENATASHLKIFRAMNDIKRSIGCRKLEKYRLEAQSYASSNFTPLQIIDTGGQPGFHEILPALITGSTVNILVIKLTENLHS